ncbi:hypothetical protein [Leifsonia sp. NPDC080035]|uniref:Uncharacterized protein n=1 Tax=Leifsonia sp. NPDC080035 TaxID=3143936 RepID=A0AAU7GDV8_9MICO
MNPKKNTSVGQRVAIGAASIVAAGALVGAGAQAALADTGNGGHPSSWSASAAAGHDGLGHDGLGRDVFSGHLSGAKAQAIAKRIVADEPLFSLLPDSLQNDLTALKDAPVAERTADAKKIVDTALDGGYGSAIQSLAKQLKEARTDHAGASQLKGLIGELRSGDLTGQELGDDGAAVAVQVTADAQLSAKLPEALRSDLSSLATAPASERTADVQKVVSTAVSGGYGHDIQQLAEQVEQQVVSGR